MSSTVTPIKHGHGDTHRRDCHWWASTGYASAGVATVAVLWRGTARLYFWFRNLLLLGCLQRWGGHDPSTHFKPVPFHPHFATNTCILLDICWDPSLHLLLLAKVSRPWAIDTFQTCFLSPTFCKKMHAYCWVLTSVYTAWAHKDGQSQALAAKILHGWFLYTRNQKAFTSQIKHYNTSTANTKLTPVKDHHMSTCKPTL